MPQKNISIATLAGGCFWGVQDLIRKLDGVVKSEVGYTGGAFANPTYEDIKTGKTGHAESIQIEFDSQRISFEKILEFFFKMHDPTSLNRQGGDVGTQYRSAIFFHDESQRLTALKIIKETDESGRWPKKIVTQVIGATQFYSAEKYHQDYLIKNPGGYTCHFLRD